MKKRSILYVLAASTLLAACQSQQTSPATDKQEKPAANENFYLHTNAEWLQTAKIPSDSVMYGVFDELTEGVDERLQADVEQLVAGKETSDLAGMDEFITLYKVATDFDKREKDGVAPAKAYLKEVEKLTSLADLQKLAKEWTLSGTPLPFYLSVSVNPEKTDEKQLELSSPSPILPDVTYYEDEAAKKDMLKLYAETAEALLVELGYKEKEAKQIVQEAIAFDATIVPYLQSSEESSDIKNLIHPKTPAELETYTSVVNLSQLAKDLVGQDVTTINVSNPNYFENLDTILTEENFANLKSWILLEVAQGTAGYLNEETREVASQYSMALSGVEELIDKEEAARLEAIDTFSETFSVYYGQKYFGPEAKTQVIEMIDHIVAVYKERLAKNDWLSAATKQKAIEKLEQMTYYVGYPEEVDPMVNILDFEEDKTYLDNMKAMERRVAEYEFAHFNEKVDKSAWSGYSYEINAYYMPTNNSITFPAGILQAPFYSLEQTDAENYGAIGTIIGHEITHAFDSNGALFDAQGNMNNWWTEEDFKAFSDKTQAMVKHFDGFEVEGGKVNGQLTVTENTADAGGLSASLEALKTTNPDADLKAYFNSYGRIWRTVVRPEVVPQLLLDTHAPAEARVNLQVNLLDDFYKVYDVKEGDAMYIPENQRVHIW